MNMKLIGSIAKTEFLGEKGKRDFYCSKGYNALVQLQEKSDIIKITLKDGSIEWLSSVNFNLGRCDCCKAFKQEDIDLYEGFKLNTSFCSGKQK